MKRYYYKYENGCFRKKFLRSESRGLKKSIFAIAGICIVLLIALIITIPQNDATKEDGSSSDTSSDTYYYNISYEDKVTMAKVVYAESRGECFEGQVAVAAVILNRYFSEISYFDTESIMAVVTQPYQFASIDDVTEEDLEKYPDCMKAVEAACKGWDPTRQMFEKGALYFYAPELTTGYQAEIRENIQVLVIGNHNFHYDFEKKQ